MEEAVTLVAVGHVADAAEGVAAAVNRVEVEMEVGALMFSLDFAHRQEPGQDCDLNGLSDGMDSRLRRVPTRQANLVLMRPAETGRWGGTEASRHDFHWRRSQNFWRLPYLFRSANKTTAIFVEASPQVGGRWYLR